MIIAIDGPAGAGKSTVARRLADRLGFQFLDTGAMYRAVAWAAAQRRLPWDHPEQLARLARQLRLEIDGDRVLVDGVDVSQQIRTAQITALTRYAANNPEVRAHLVQLQRRLAQGRNIVSEGRDQGTVVFPDACCKFYLTASPQERARRRLAQMAARGETACYDEVLAQQIERDRSDSQREVGPLKAAADAVHVDTDGLSVDEVVDRLERLVRQKMQSTSNA